MEVITTDESDYNYNYNRFIAELRGRGKTYDPTKEIQDQGIDDDVAKAVEEGAKGHEWNYKITSNIVEALVATARRQTPGFYRWLNKRGIR